MGFMTRTYQKDGFELAGCTLGFVFELPGKPVAHGLHDRFADPWDPSKRTLACWGRYHSGDSSVARELWAKAMLITP